MRKKIYLSGAMTGVEDLNKPLFEKVAESLRLLGWDVVNPHDVQIALDFEDTPGWLDYMIADLETMKDCTAICMLPGWEKSYGARIEHLVAEKTDMDIFYYERHAEYQPCFDKNLSVKMIALGGVAWSEVGDPEILVRNTSGDEE